MSVIELLRAALVEPLAEGGGIRGDDLIFSNTDGSVRPAAVLVPVVDRGDAFNLILTRRRDDLRHHAGQISFPGGAREAGDDDAVDTALRETHEEIGVHRDHVRVLGPIETYRTVSGFEVTPIVGVVASEAGFTPQAEEVAEIFEVPLDYVLNSDNHRSVSGFFRGRDRTYYEIVFGEWRIWGATAGMIVNLSRRVSRARAID